MLEAIGWFGSALLVVSLLQNRVMRFRVLNAAASLVLVGYNAALEVWPMVALNTALVVINAVVILRLLRRRHDPRAYDVVPISPDEPFLRHLLQRHAEDVAHFNPRLPPDVLSIAQHAFLVSVADQVVGVVLSRGGAVPGEQQVLLDYVLPAYRDFTPGEFVFRADGPFAAMGTTTIVASPGMEASERYLQAVGFVHRDDRRVLHLDPR